MGGWISVGGYTNTDADTNTNTNQDSKFQPTELIQNKIFLKLTLLIC